MKRVVACLSVALLIAAATAGPVASQHIMRIGVAKPPFDEYDWERASCVVRGGMWVQEMGLSGITRLRFRLNLYNTYDPGWTPWNAPLSTGWMYGPTFADDLRSRWTTFYYSLGHDYRIVYKARAFGRGERPSFWQLDRKYDVNVGEVFCDPGPVVA